MQLFNKISIYKDDRKYFTIVFFIFAALLLSGIVTSIFINFAKNNYEKNKLDFNNLVDEFVNEELKTTENDLLDKLQLLKKDLRKEDNLNFKEALAVLQKEDYTRKRISVFDRNAELKYWKNDLVLLPKKLFPLYFPLGQTYFYDDGLRIYLTVLDTFYYKGNRYYLNLSTTFKKYYKVKEVDPNQYLEEKLAAKFNSYFEVRYHPFAEVTKGKSLSVVLKNKNNKKIGVVYFNAPSPENSVRYITNVASIVQSILIILLLMFLALAFRSDYKKIEYPEVKLLLFIVFLFIIRYILLLTNLPALLFTKFSDPAYFSSKLWGGIFKSPLDLLISNIIAAAIIYNLYKYSKYLKYRFNFKNPLHNNALNISALILLMTIFLMSFRGLYATIKSIVFDSSYRYFNTTDILPDSISIMMNFNILLLTANFFLLLFSLLILINKVSQINYKKILVVFFLLTIVFYFIQNNPLASLTVYTINYFLIAGLFYMYKTGKAKLLLEVFYLLIASSFLSIILMGNYNKSLERESLKQYAYDINRTNESFYNFTLDGVINETLEFPQIKNYFRLNKNYSSAAFNLWTESILRRESLISGIGFYDANKKYLGGFFVSGAPFYKVDSLLYNDNRVDEYLEYKHENEKYYYKYSPIKDGEVTIGYVCPFIKNEFISYGSNIPDLLKSTYLTSSRAVNLNELSIYKIEHGTVTGSYGNFYSSSLQLNSLTKIESNEEWKSLSIDGINYETFILKSNNNSFVIVVYPEKELTLNLFYFFKLFLVHSLFISIFFVLVFFVRVRKIKFSFRLTLLVAFLFISILPLVLLALYNRQIVNQKSNEAITNELNERTVYIENHIASQLIKNPTREDKILFDNTAKELNIKFNFYKDKNKIYSAADSYSNAGLFENILDPNAFYRLQILQYKNFIASKMFEQQGYNVLFKRVNIRNQEYTLSVNDIYNKVNLPLSTTDVDVFLFGIYSFALLIIVLVSTFLANKISDPIQRLTYASQAAAQGDLNVHVANSERGELKILIDQFNNMIASLKKNEVELAELERENAWKEMARQVAHEIKNPLTPMKLAVQQLIISFNDKNKNFESIFNRVSTTILNQIENLNQIASEFSRFSKTPNYKLEKINILSLIQDVSNLYSEEKIDIIIDPVQMEDYLIDSDSAQFRRMLINFIRNSIQAEATKIVFTIGDENNFYCLTISDNGRGISEENKSKIFEHNFTTKQSGMGIGLKLTKRFIENLNGTISLLDTNENGTTFKVCLPKN